MINSTEDRHNGRGTDIENNGRGTDIVGNSSSDQAKNDDDDEHGLIRPHSLQAPFTPSRQEVLEHELTHLPYRSWCECCRRGKSVSHGHYSRPETEEENRVPLAALDYAFLSKTDGDGQALSEVKTMVIKDKRSKCVFPIPVPQKGVDPEEYSVRQLLRVLDYLGYSEIILKCDQESALKKVIDGAKTHRGPGTQTMTENSAVGDSKGNGLVERANRTVEGQVRTMVIALESKLGKTIDASSSVFPWLVLHAGTLLNRFSVAADGKTPHERLRGKKSRKQLIEFGESIHFMPLNALDKPNIDSRFQDGIWLGVRLGTDEYLVGTSNGVFKARSIRRKIIEHRWDHAQVAAVMGTPWKPYAFTEDDRLRIDIPEVSDGSREVEPRARIEDPAPKRVRIERRDLERLGYTPGCPGCYNAKHSRAHRAHTQHCRDRLQKCMAEDPGLKKRIESATDRENRWLAEEIEKTQKPVFDAELSQGPLPHTSAFEPSQPPVEVQSALNKEESDELDTNDFYMEVNAELADKITDEAMDEISRLGDSVDEETLVINIVNEAFKKLLSGHRPMDREPDPDMLNVMRAASDMGDPHISEIYYPPRVSALSERFGMRPGFALDLTVLDTDGEPWDFDKPEKRRRAMELLKSTRPKLLIGSPMCRAFSVLQGLNRARMGEQKWNAMKEHGVSHLKFVAELYLEQMNQGRYFLHEHPASASNWKEPEITELASYPTHM